MYSTDLVEQLKKEHPRDQTIDLREIDQRLMRDRAESFQRTVAHVRAWSALIVVPLVPAGALWLLAGWNAITWLLLTLWSFAALPTVAVLLIEWLRYLLALPRDHQRSPTYVRYEVLDNDDWIMAEWNRDKTQLTPVGRWSKNGNWYALEVEEAQQARVHHDAEMSSLLETKTNANLE